MGADQREVSPKGKEQVGREDPGKAESVLFSMGGLQVEFLEEWGRMQSKRAPHNELEAWAGSLREHQWRVGFSRDLVEQGASGHRLAVGGQRRKERRWSLKCPALAWGSLS